MRSLVVDASVAVKWFVPEDGSDQAALLLDGSHELLAPDLLWPEVGNIVWKKVRRGDLTAPEAREVLRALARVPLAIVSSRGLAEAALEIALAHDRTVYDGTYVALAVAQDCRLVTADGHLVRALAGGALAARVTTLALH